MKITATTTFLDGTERYEEGEEYDVDDARGGYFVGNGWASGPDGYVGPGANQNEVRTLQPDDVVTDLSVSQPSTKKGR